MKETFEEKLEAKQTAKEIKEIFPDYNEKVILHEGEKSKICELLGHKERIVHHQFFAKDTERGRERYECWVCPRCKNIEGKLVHIAKK